jgi:predicted nucleic acid-binding protein
MILVDTGPLVALFDRRDPAHLSCRRTLQGIREGLRTTVPVLTEAFHMLSPSSRGADRLREFVVGDFETYRVRRGHRQYPFESIG